jgi:hypothetical protein
VRDREVDLQDTTIGDAVRVEDDPHGFGVSGRPAADHRVMRRVAGAAGIPGNRGGDPLDMLEHALDTPEAAARQDRDFGGEHAGLTLALNEAWLLLGSVVLLSLIAAPFLYRQETNGGFGRDEPAP